MAVRADVTGVFPNPPMRNEAFTVHINRNIFEALVSFDRHLKPAPALAERWENPTDDTYVFTLRPNLRFSDGSPLGAEDVVASIMAAESRGWPTSGYLQGVESIESIGSRQVKISTGSSYFVLLSKLPFGFVVPARLLGSAEVPPVGAGPYVIESWQPGREMTLARNRYFSRSAPAYDRVRLLVVPEVEARLGMVEAGKAEIADHVPPQLVERIEANPALRLVERDSLRVIFLGLRVDRAPFSDPRVREAFDLGIDRRQLVDRVLAGRSRAASQIVPQAVFGHVPELGVTNPDRERARKLLAEAGYPDGLDVRLDGPSNRYVNDLEIMQELARQLAGIGVTVRLNAMAKSVWYETILEGTSSLHLLGWACESGDAGDALDAVLHSRTPGFGGTNTTGLADAELDQLIEQANAARDLIGRATALRAAVTRAAQLRPILPLVVQREIVACSRRVAWEPSVTLALDFSQIRPAE